MYVYMYMVITFNIENYNHGFPAWSSLFQFFTLFFWATDNFFLHQRKNPLQIVGQAFSSFGQNTYASIKD